MFLVLFLCLFSDRAVDKAVVVYENPFDHDGYFLTVHLQGIIKI